MQHVLTLVGKPLAPEAVEAARAALPRCGEPDWLMPGEACDLALPDGEAALVETVRQALAGRAVDLCLQPAEGRRKKLLLADMDSTIITVECIDEMADLLGLKPQIAAITAQAMRGEIDFAAALRQRVALLKGLGLDDLQRVHLLRVRLSPGARTLVATMRRHGAYTALISGGFTFFTGRVRKAAGFDEDRANSLEVVDARLTGQVHEPILDSRAKLATLQELSKRRGLAPTETMALGDGANDRPMIEAAGLGIAYRAKPVLAEAADARIDHADLTAALYFQGYRNEEFDG